MAFTARKRLAIRLNTLTHLLLALLLGGPLLLLYADSLFAASPSVAETIQRVQAKMVKIYGAGGMQGLEAYQSGSFVTGQGHILTSWSYVLDTDTVTVVLHDGRRLIGRPVGIDPRLDLAVLQVPVEGNEHFDLQSAGEVSVGARVLAFSNLYGIAAGNEPTSVLHGVVSAVTELAARRGAFPSPYQGRVYVLDAVTNNAGAAGGALTDFNGNFVGMLGKELRNSADNTWLNYALPAAEVRSSVADILAGKTPGAETPSRSTAQSPVTTGNLGVVLVPNVLSKTPAFVEFVRPDSPAAQAGLQTDDLVVMVNGQAVQSQRDLESELQFIEAGDSLKLILLRGQELLEVELKSTEPDARTE
ncbi:MAG: S1C family serine protease [Pirellulales bacterium]